MKTIDVIFSLHYCTDDKDGGISVTQITPRQLKQLQKNVEKAHQWKGTCPTFVKMEYKDCMTFMGGRQDRNTPTKHIRELKISNPFWLSDTNLACGKCAQQNENAKAQHCMRNLCAGKCQDPFMRGAIGAVLFPKFYAKKKQK